MPSSATASKRGVIDVLRHGIKDKSHHIDLYYSLPTPGNERAAQNFSRNMFSVTRQVRFSRANGQALDLVVFVNGLRCHRTARA